MHTYRQLVYVGLDALILLLHRACGPLQVGADPLPGNGLAFLVGALHGLDDKAVVCLTVAVGALSLATHEVLLAAGLLRIRAELVGHGQQPRTQPTRRVFEPRFRLCHASSKSRKATRLV